MHHERRREHDRLDHRRDVRASVRRWPGRVRGPTRRSSACRAGSTPTTRPCYFEMTDMDSWYRGRRPPHRALATFRGERAVFIHNALLYPGGRPLPGRGRPRDIHRRRHHRQRGVRRSCSATCSSAPPQPAVDAGVDCGLVQISSASARIAYPGLAIYGAAKASMEQWVRAVRAEREDRGKGPWVGAIRPGFVDTPAARRDAELPEDAYPGVKGIAEAVRTGKGMLGADEAAENIWNAIPDDVIAQAGTALRRSGRRHHVAQRLVEAARAQGSAAASKVVPSGEERRDARTPVSRSISSSRARHARARPTRRTRRSARPGARRARRRHRRRPTPSTWAEQRRRVRDGAAARRRRGCGSSWPWSRASSVHDARGRRSGTPRRRSRPLPIMRQRIDAVEVAGRDPIQRHPVGFGRRERQVRAGRSPRRAAQEATWAVLE